jgi:hypothetical protein
VQGFVVGNLRFASDMETSFHGMKSFSFSTAGWHEGQSHTLGAVEPLVPDLYHVENKAVISK